jgi:hypothetical protein
MSEAARLSVNCLPFVRLQSVATVMLLSIPAAHGEMHFTNVTAAANILHTHSHAPGTTFENPEFGRMTGGAVAEDFDGDGWTDLYVLQGGEFPNLLYMNQGDGTFANQAATMSEPARRITTMTATSTFSSPPPPRPTFC